MKGNALSSRAPHFLWAMHLLSFAHPGHFCPHIIFLLTHCLGRQDLKSFMNIKTRLGKIWHDSVWLWAASLCTPNQHLVCLALLQRRNVSGPRLYLLCQQAIEEACWFPTYLVLLSKYSNVIIDFDKLGKKSLTELPPTNFHAGLVCFLSWVA